MPAGRGRPPAPEIADHAFGGSVAPPEWRILFRCRRQSPLRCRGNSMRSPASASTRAGYFYPTRPAATKPVQKGQRGEQQIDQREPKPGRRHRGKPSGEGIGSNSLTAIFRYLQTPYLTQIPAQQHYRPRHSAACVNGTERKFLGSPALAIAPCWTTFGRA